MIERRKPLRRTGLKRPTSAQVRAWHDRPRKPIDRGTTPLKRATKAIAKVGPKARRERAALDRFREQIRARAGGRCEAPTYGHRPDGTVIVVKHDVPLERRHDGAHAHHVWPEDHDAGRHDPTRGLYLCAASHRWSHLNPDDAKIVGTLRPELSLQP